MELVASGTPQACEAAFSPMLTFSAAGRAWAPLLAGLRVCGAEVFEKYERTVRAHAHGDFKRRRHAVRLSFDLADLRRDGRFDPVMTATQIHLANRLAERFEGDELLERLL